MGVDKIIVSCRERQMQCYANQIVFEKRINWYGGLIKYVTILGIIIPVFIGAVVLGYGIDNPILKGLIPYAAILSIIQFFSSVIIYLIGIDSKLMYSYDANKSYNSMYNKYKDLADFYDIYNEDIKIKYDLIRVLENERSMQDSSQNIKEWEYRRGLRASLRIHKKKCVSCNKIPYDLNSDKCKVCGNFSFKNRILS